MLDSSVELRGTLPCTYSFALAFSKLLWHPNKAVRDGDLDAKGH